MSIYDKITNCDKIVCFINGSNINHISVIYKKDMVKTHFFYDAVISIIDSTAKHFLIEDITLCGYETVNSKEIKSIFKGCYTNFQKLLRGVI